MSQPPDEGARDPRARPVPDERDLERVVGTSPVRRAPRYRAFVLVGVLLGVVVAVPVVLLLADAPAARPEPGGVAASTSLVLLFVGLGLAMLGALLGAVVAVLLDRSGRRPRG